MSTIKCWICNDVGLVFYEKRENNLVYEMALRCSCEKALRTSRKIEQVGEELAIDLAVRNYEKANL